MLSKLRSRLNYSTVMSTLALFVALGTGGAYAANTVGSADIIDNAILGADIKNAQVGVLDVATNTINSARVIDNTLTGADILESSLGKVGDADTLDGLNSSSLVGPRAYGRIDPGGCAAGAYPQVCTVTSAKNVTSVTRIDPGIYCITVPGGSPLSVPLIATVDVAGTAYPEADASVMTASGGCTAGGFAVFTQRHPWVEVSTPGGGVTTVAGTATFANTVGFTFVAP